ncbi:MAG: AsmA family protein [Rhizobiales bacterium]|nr:AsmA family protein [Rhizobacter sp.]
MGALLLVVVFIAAFEWTWFRPLIQHHIHERSGRHIDFDELHIGLNRALQPTVRLRNFAVENAPWAAQRPLVRAAEFGFTLSWRSLRGGPVELTRLELVDAELDLERRADGLRNWRLTTPDDRGPGKVRVLSIDARDTRARFVNQSLGLEFDLHATMLAAPMPSANAGLPLTKQVSMRGTREGTAFEAQFSLSDVLTFFDTGQPFALRGELRSGASRARLEGTSTDLMQLPRLDLDLQLAGPRLAELTRVLGMRLPLPPLPTTATARVLKEGERWRVSQVQARIGRSDLAGEAEFDRRRPGEGRSMLRASLTSQRVDVGDLRGGRPAAPVPNQGDEAARAGNLDADLDLKIARVEGFPLGPATGMSGHAALREGRWSLDPVAFALAGGRAAGKATVDTTGAAPAYTLDLRLQGLQIDRLARTPPQPKELTGALDLRIAMRARGDSRESLAGAATGTLQAELVGASIPEALEAKLALDGGRLLRGLFGGEGERTRITCSALDLRFEAGRGSVRRLAFDTPQVAFAGTGAVDLGRGTLDLVLTPRRKQSALLALDRALQVSGPFGAPKLALRAPESAPAGEPCVPGSAQ